ncbi:hypothetical protein CJ030_MR0G025667 [Morella rubra]|uniref:Uncharacterized protein n=1 Tax=Morella rubra TaxID=262757 RepID=A0A6A1UG66_9ROSI|nr:hypothetical protein CJ030_MR0G025667 [Morella rubra]
MDNLPIQKIAISGRTLASLIQRLSTSSGPIDGFLFGHVSLLTPSTLSDDSTSTTAGDNTSSSFSQTLILTITSFLSSTTTSPTFYSTSGRVHTSLLPQSPSTLLGWFSSRRRSPLRPSMREFSVSESLFSLPPLSFPILNFSSVLSPCIFLLLASPIPNQAIHTHEYRAYQFRDSTYSFDPKSIDIINIGPAFRGHYGDFSPNSLFSPLACELRSSPMVEDKEDGNLSWIEHTAEDQKQLDQCAEGFKIERLTDGPLGCLQLYYRLEDLYEKMLVEIKSMARQVELNSVRFLSRILVLCSQENHNRKLRHKVARFTGSE